MLELVPEGGGAGGAAAVLEVVRDGGAAGARGRRLGQALPGGDGMGADGTADSASDGGADLQ